MTDFTSQVYAKLWALLIADTDWAALVKPGNRIRFDQNDADPLKPNLQDGDVPQCVILPPGFNYPVFGTTHGYGMTDSVTASTNLAQMAWKERSVETFQIVLTHSDLRMGEASNLKHVTLKALRKGGARLGLSAVHSWGPVTGSTTIAARSVDATGNPVGTTRLVTTLQVPVTIDFNGQDEL